jgi:hypothetical protein
VGAAFVRFAERPTTEEQFALINAIGEVIPPADAWEATFLPAASLPGLLTADGWVLVVRHPLLPEEIAGAVPWAFAAVDDLRSYLSGRYAGFDHVAAARAALWN